MLSVNLDSPEPLADQIVRGIRAAIASGRLPAGAELPPVRQLAADLGMNWNTVARAYRVLKQDGLVHMARGRGTRVAAVRETNAETPQQQQARLVAQARRLIADAKLAGWTRRELERLWNRECRAMWPSKKKRSRT